MNNWRVGRKISLNVYDGDRPVCQCHTDEDAKLIAEAVNRLKILEVTSGQFAEGWFSYDGNSEVVRHLYVILSRKENGNYVVIAPDV